MPQVSHELEKFLLHDPEKSLSTVHISVAQPTPLEARTFGRLFALVEIGSRAPMNAELIGILQDEMQRTYYQGPQLRVEAAFEHALQHVNEQLKRLIESGMTDWLEHFNIVIGVLKDQALILTHIGNVHATLIHRGRIIDIIETAGPEDRRLNPLKIFSNIISGEIQEDDYLVIFTPSLLDYLSQEKLKRIVLDRPPVDAVRHLDELLEEAPPRTAFGALIIHAVPATESPENVTAVTQASPAVFTGQTRTSMEDLIARERATERLLAPSLWLVIRRFVAAAANWFNQTLSGRLGRSRQMAGRSRRFAGSVGTSAGPTRPSVAALGQESLGSLAAASTRGGQLVGRTVRAAIAQRGSLLSALRSAPRALGTLLARLIAAFPRWSFIRKVLFLAIIVLLFFFAQSIVTMGRRSEQERTSVERGATIASIEEKTFQAEAALSYDDEVRASRLIGEAADLFAGLETEKNRDDETIRRLSDSIERIREKTRHLVRIDQPTVLASLGNSAGPDGLSDLALVRGSLYVTGGIDNGLVAVNAEDGEASIVENSLEGAAGSLRFIARQGTQSAVAYDGANRFVEYVPASNRLRGLSFTPANVDTAIVDVATYQSRVYLLDTKNAQVFRYQQGAEGFGQASAWLQEPSSDLSSAVSLAVDGSVYLLYGNGRVEKYSQGRRDDFTLQAIDPTLDSASKLWTDEKASNLYVLDRASQRLVVFTKTGRLVSQFTSTAFTDLKGLAVDEAVKKAYLLNGTDVFAVDLNAGE